VNGGALLVVAVLVFGAWRVIDLAVNPWRKCRACGGDGKGRWSHGLAYGDCKKCDGGQKERELRLGAKYVRPDLKEKK
jgi:hypothetical protein